MKKLSCIVIFLIWLTQFGSAQQKSRESLHTSTLELRSNKIPDSIFQIKELKHLSVQGMDCDYGDYTTCWMINEIPASIQNLENLESLRLNVNAINSIPKEIVKLKKLRSVDLTDNSGLENIDALMELENLEELYLFGCNMSTLPSKIRHLKKLKYLGLTGNNIDEKELEWLKTELPHCKIIFEK